MAQYSAPQFHRHSTHSPPPFDSISIVDTFEMAMPLPRDELGGLRIHMFLRPSIPICFLIGRILANSERHRCMMSGVKLRVREPEVISSMYLRRRGHAREAIAPEIRESSRERDMTMPNLLRKVTEMSFSLCQKMRRSLTSVLG